MHAVRRLLVLPVLLCMACTGGLTESSSPNLQVATDSAVYERSEAGEAVARLTVQHNGGRSVALTGCPHPPALYLERATSARWEEAHSSGIICLGIHSPSTVALGATASLAFAVSTWEPGRYRVRILIGPDMAAPEGTVLSNEFVVR